MNRILEAVRAYFNAIQNPTDEEKRIQALLVPRASSRLPRYVAMTFLHEASMQRRSQMSRCRNLPAVWQTTTASSYSGIVWRL